MKTASPALTALINSGNFDTWECYTFTLVSGGQLLMTSAPFNIISGGVTWPRRGPVVMDADGNGPRGHWKVGTDVDQWALDIAPRVIDDLTGAAYPDKIGDQPFLAGLVSGLLDAADVVVQRAYFDPTQMPAAAPVAGLAPVGMLTIFRGLVSDVDLSVGEAVVTISDYRQLLTTQMPCNIYQAGCEHTLYDSQCKLNPANFVQNGAVISSSSRSQMSMSAPAPGGSGTYALGRVTMTSGENKGLSRTIISWDGAKSVTFSPPMPFTIKPGDTVAMLPGCDKTMTTCQLFGNILNYGGDPFIPPPTTSGL